ncbi:hypothetical protein M2316_000733 [Cellulosimicrobium cellulans]|nr:hypothetical protein [Cellulosimicrobium cellulans]
MTNQQGDEYTAKPDRPLTLAEIKAQADATVAATPEPRWERTILWAALLLAALFTAWAPWSDRPPRLPAHAVQLARRGAADMAAHTRAAPCAPVAQLGPVS